MKTASYITTQTTTGGSGKYPLSTQTLDFIQSQILLLQQLSLIGGKRYILKQPDGTAVGYVVIDGEVLPMAARPIMGDNTKFITVKTEKANIEADGETYVDARTVRTAAYSPVKVGTENYEVNTFTNFATNTTLNAQIKNMPSTISAYLHDTLEGKLTTLTVTGMTKEQLDGITTPCIINCVNSAALIGSYVNYNVFTKRMGDTIHQEMTTPNGTKYYRTVRPSLSDIWEPWRQVNENLHIDVKISKGTVYLRHGELPERANIVLLRKKKRSKFRHTGGRRSLPNHLGRRVQRLPKSQYVHYKGVILSKGVANEWYVPACISVANDSLDNVLIGKDIAGVCKGLIRESRLNNESIFHIFGLRKRIAASQQYFPTQACGYVPIAVQVVYCDDGRPTSRGGEMVKMKYRISHDKNSANHNLIWYRSFSLD